MTDHGEEFADHGRWQHGFTLYQELLHVPLIIKRGGHADQLSRAPGLDKYRIRAITNLLEGNYLAPPQRQAAIAALTQKCAVYAGGCRKRGKEEEAKYYDQLADRFK